MRYFRSRTARYLLALASVTVALGVRLLLDPILGTTAPYSMCYGAITITAALAGIGPAILAFVLGGLVSLYFFVPPVHTFSIATTAAQLGVVLYFSLSTLLIFLAELLRRSSRRAELAQLAERQERLRLETTLSAISGGVIALSAEGLVTFLNDTAAQLTGWPLIEAAGQPVREVFRIEEEGTGLSAEMPALSDLRKAVNLPANIVMIASDGRRIPIDAAVSPILDPLGNLTGAVLTFRDITIRRSRDRELFQQQRAIDIAHDAIILMDSSRRILGWNHGAEEMYGFSAAEARGQITHDLLRTRGPVAMAEIDAHVERAGRWDGDLVHTRRDGIEITVASRHVALREDSGRITALLEINRDITDAEEGRRTLKAVLDYVPEGLVIATAPDGRVIHVSRHGLELMNAPADEVVGKARAELTPGTTIYRPDGRQVAELSELPLFRALRNGELIVNEEWVVRRPDGSRIHTLCDAAPIRSDDGRITAAIVTWRDITERRELQEKLRETARLESLGVLAGGIAHDFNNLLTGILGNASLLAEFLPNQTPEASWAHEIIFASERAARLVHQMLAYSGRGRFVIEPLNLSHCVLQTADLVRSSIGKNVELAFDLADSLPLMQADSTQIQQLVMNLVINAAESIGPQGGRVTITTGHADSNVLLEVIDNGCGMTEETLSRIFDPFFSTKFVGRGLGLSAVQGIVRAHNGSLNVTSKLGEGTVFRVVFPTRPGLAASSTHDGPPARLPLAHETVLVIDDEEIVRSTARNALEKLGYNVLTAADGAEGVEHFRSLRDSISTVLLDLTMPGLSGEATMNELRSIRPDARIVLSSGFSETEAMQRFGSAGVQAFLQKPYTAQALARCINSVNSGNPPLSPANPPVFLPSD
jgi:PAS domain S-box-containing protein